MLKTGGDFNDVIAYDGERLWGIMSFTFDRKAAEIIKAQGRAARRL